MPEPLASHQLTADTERLCEKTAFLHELLDHAEKSVIGQRPLLEGILLGLLCQGHVLIEGAPGLAKTLAAKTVAALLHLQFQRVQFTPDLLPADLTGTPVYHPPSGEFRTRKGPVFSNLLLADEINRAPAKVQSALLEAMEERQVTLGEETHPLPDPFCVLATQNPLEHEGTYPLPEAQLDRFLFKLLVDYPAREAEEAMLEQRNSFAPEQSAPIVDGDQLRQAQQALNDVYCGPEVRHYLLDLVTATRSPADAGCTGLSGLIAHGISPRGTLFLATAARAHAMLRQRPYVTPEDVQQMAGPVMRHRLILSYEADVESVTTDHIIAELLKSIPTP